MTARIRHSSSQFSRGKTRGIPARTLFQPTHHFAYHFPPDSCHSHPQFPEEKLVGIQEFQLEKITVPASGAGPDHKTFGIEGALEPFVTQSPYVKIPRLAAIQLY